ncbi:MAG TPA: ribonuclease T2 [Dongiaceae bacterium]|jgi:ribonuclease T2|nr:ribonuclease T2 [Dongiaceae bacterium]
MGEACHSVEARRGVAGVFDYYTFVLSWAPSFCRDHPAGNATRFECRDNRFGFVVHGLWPERSKGPWPQYCGDGAPLLAAQTASLLCTVPSPRLLQCEWRKHGSCSGLSAEEYLQKLQQLRDIIHIPKEFSENSDRRIAAAGLAATFTRANPALPPAAFVPICGLSSGMAVFKEMRICFDRDFHAQACPALPRSSCKGGVLVPGLR